MYEKLICGCIIKLGTFSHMSLEKACPFHSKLGMGSKGFGKLKTVARFKRLPRN